MVAVASAHLGVHLQEQLVKKVVAIEMMAFPDSFVDEAWISFAEPVHS